MNAKQCLGLLSFVLLLSESGIAWAQTKAAKQMPPTELEQLARPAKTANGQSFQFTVPANVKLEDGLTADEAVAIALWNNAPFQATLAELGIARAALVEAGLLHNPTFSFLFPLGPKQLEFTLLAPLEAIWQRPKRVAVAERELERLSQSLVPNGLDLVRDVRLAFAEVVLAEARAALAQEQVKERTQLLKITNVRLRAGDVSELETSAARLDERLAEEQVARSQQSVSVARVRLRTLLGLEEGAYALVLTPLAAESASPAALPELTKQALAARPELRAAELALEAAGARAKWERSKIYSLTALLDANGAGREGFEIGPGLQFEIPLFHRNKGGITRAEAEIERAARQYVAVRQSIVMEVQAAHAQVIQARTALDLWRAHVLPTLEADIRQAGKAYDAGDVAYLFVLETTRRLTDARTRELDSVAELQRANVLLERSLGGKLNAK